MADSGKNRKVLNARKKFIRFFKDIRAELKKVIWPNKEQLTKNTITVLFACLIVGLIIWIADFVLAKLLELTLMR